MRINKKTIISRPLKLCINYAKSLQRNNLQIFYLFCDLYFAKAIKKHAYLEESFDDRF